MDITKEKPNRTLLVLKYLWDNSDIDHPATIKDIAAYLEGFGYNATRKTISKDIDELIEIGIDNERNIICISLMYVSLNLQK